MKIPPESWLFPEDYAKAAEAQREMAQQVLVEDHFGKIENIVGLDVSCNFRDPKKMIYAAAVSLNTNLHIVEECLSAEGKNFLTSRVF